MKRAAPCQCAHILYVTHGPPELLVSDNGHQFRVWSSESPRSYGTSKMFLSGTAEAGTGDEHDM